MNYQEICDHVLHFDPAIRFTGIATLEGDIVADKYGKGLTPLLTYEESQMSVMQSLIRAGIRKTLEEKLGKTVYSCTTYQKVKRATVTIYNKGGTRADALLMVSFEKEADHEKIINEKILPFLTSSDKGLTS